MFNNTSRYFDDIFTIDNPEFEKHIPDTHQTELKLNKANIADKETSFLDLNIKMIGNDFHTSVYNKRDDFGFPTLKASAHSFKQFTSRLLKSTFSLSLCTYITRMNVMLDFICMDQST